MRLLWVVAMGLAFLVGWYAGIKGNKPIIVQLRSELETRQKVIEKLLAVVAQRRTEIDALQERNEVLQESNKALLERIEELTTVVAPRVMYEDVLKGPTYNGAGFQSGEYLLLVDVLLRNTGKSATHVTHSNFKLKDLNNNVYLSLRLSVVGKQPRFINGVENLPDGRTELTDLDLDPGEEVRSTLVFYVTRDVRQFKITYRGDTELINL